MTMAGEQILTGQILGEHGMVSLTDICRSCAVEVETHHSAGGRGHSRSCWR